jgi:formyltetrahydrofolate synthetase
VPVAAAVVNQTAKPDNTNTRKGLAAAIGAAIGSQTIGRIIGGSAGSVVGLLGGAAGGFFYASNNKPNLDLTNGTAVNLQTTADVEVPRRQAEEPPQAPPQQQPPQQQPQ